MSDVKRYVCFGGCEEHQHGGWIESSDYDALRAEVDALKGLLREVRMRTQNLLDRQHGDAIIMNPDEYLRATLSLLDAALADQPNGHS